MQDGSSGKTIDTFKEAEEVAVPVSAIETGRDAALDEAQRLAGSVANFEAALENAKREESAARGRAQALDGLLPEALRKFRPQG